MILNSSMLTVVYMYIQLLCICNMSIPQYNPTIRAMTIAFNYKVPVLYVPQILRADNEITAIRPTTIINDVL